MALASFYQRVTQHSSGEPDLLLHGKGASCLQSTKLGAGKAIVEPQRLMIPSYCLKQRVGFIQVWILGCHSYCLWRTSLLEISAKEMPAFSKLFTFVFLLKTVGNCWDCPKGSEWRTRTSRKVSRHQKKSSVVGDIYQVDLPLLIPKCPWHMVYKLSLLFPQAKMTGMGPGHHWRPLQLGQWREHTESTHMDVIKNKQEGKNISYEQSCYWFLVSPRIPVALPTTDK